MSNLTASVFIRARNEMLRQLIEQMAANVDAEMLGRPLPYPPKPSTPAYARPDDPCDDWSQDEDEDYDF